MWWWRRTREAKVLKHVAVIRHGSRCVRESVGDGGLISYLGAQGGALRRARSARSEIFEPMR